MSLLAKLLNRKPAPGVVEEETPPPDHRRTEREGAYRVVTVTYPTGYVRKGIIVDLSNTGARIRFSQRGEMPPRVIVRIEGVSGLREVETVWQETYDAGVRFVD